MTSEHVVQFFDTDESRTEHVAAFLAEGHAAGEPLVVIARPIHWAAMIAPLEARGVPVHDVAASGMLVVKDATDTLRRFSRLGTPDAALFEEIVGKSLKPLAARGPRVRAYGEMVDLLAQRGDLADAVAVETFWNTLSERLSIFLMCGYSAAHFVSTATHEALLDICRCHTDVRRHVHDPLAAWLLTAAHNGPSAATTLQH